MKLVEIKRPEFKSELKKLWIDWMLVSTTHGLSSITRTSSRLVRLIWLLCFLASFSFCVYSIIQLVVQFFNYDVLINLQVSDAKTVDFPAVRKQFNKLLLLMLNSIHKKTLLIELEGNRVQLKPDRSRRSANLHNACSSFEQY